MLQVQDIPMNKLAEADFNRRRNYDLTKLDELAKSIDTFGIIQPITVRALDGSGRFEILAGSRRYRAAKIAKLLEIPSIVKTVTDQAALEIQLVENLQREDLTPLEEADSYRQLIDVVKYKVEDIAKRIGKSGEHVYARLKLLELNKPTQAALADNKISTEHALLLCRVKDPKIQTKLLARSTSPHRPLTVRELRDDIRDQEDSDKKNRRVQGEMDKARALGTKVVKIFEQRHTGAKTVGSYGSDKWISAGKKKCEHVALGFVLDFWGAVSGRSLKVCLDPKGCKVHNPPSTRTAPSAAEKKFRIQRLAEQRKSKSIALARTESIGLVVGKVKRLDTSLLREITSAFAHDVWHEHIKSICQRRDWAAKKHNYGYMGYREAIDKRIKSMRERELIGLLVELTMLAHMGADTRLAKRFRVNLRTLQRQHLATLNVTARRPSKKKATKKMQTSAKPKRR